MYAKASENDSVTLRSVAFLSFDAIGGKDVMPIGGFYGPAIEGINDTTFDHYSATAFNMFQDLGVNLLLYQNADYNDYENRVKTLVLDLAGNRDIGVFITDKYLTNKASGGYLTTTEQMATQMAKYDNYKAFAGIHVVDEPGSADWKPDLAAQIEYYAGAYTRLSQLGVVGSVNLNPIKDGTEEEYTNYVKYVEEFCSTCNPAYLSFDYYVWDSDTTQEGYFHNMSIIREKGQEYNIPFWSFVQAGGQWEATNPGDLYPNEGQFNWSVNTALACGAKGISYFPLIQPKKFAVASGESRYDLNGLIGADGSKTQWYNYAKAANAQITAVDEYLMTAISDGIIVNGSNATADTANFTDRITGKTYNQLTGVEGEAIIGCFRYAGKTALYVTNYNTVAQDITLTFDGDYTVTCVDEGVKSDLSLTGTGTQLSLAGGEGVLLVFDK